MPSQKISPLPDLSAPEQSHILNGVVAYVEVRTKHDNHSTAVRQVLGKMGACIEDKLTNDVTHVIFKEGRKRTKERACKLGAHLVSVLWVDSCMKRQCWVSEEDFSANTDHCSTPPPGVRLKKYRSMQPVDYDEMLARSNKRCEKRRRCIKAQCGAALVPSSSATPVYSADHVLVVDTQPCAHFCFRDLRLQSPLVIPNTPPSMQARLDQMLHSRHLTRMEEDATPTSSSSTCGLQKHGFPRRLHILTRDNSDSPGIACSGEPAKSGHFYTANSVESQKEHCAEGGELVSMLGALATEVDSSLNCGVTPCSRSGHSSVERFHPHDSGSTVPMHCPQRDLHCVVDTTTTTASANAIAAIQTSAFAEGCADMLQMGSGGTMGSSSLGDNSLDSGLNLLSSRRSLPSHLQTHTNEYRVTGSMTVNHDSGNARCVNGLACGNPLEQDLSHGAKNRHCGHRGNGSKVDSIPNGHQSNRDHLSAKSSRPNNPKKRKLLTLNRDPHRALISTMTETVLPSRSGMLDGRLTEKSCDPAHIFPASSLFFPRRSCRLSVKRNWYTGMSLPTGQVNPCSKPSLDNTSTSSPDDASHCHSPGVTTSSNSERDANVLAVSMSAVLEESSVQSNGLRSSRNSLADFQVQRRQGFRSKSSVDCDVARSYLRQNPRPMIGLKNFHHMHIPSLVMTSVHRFEQEVIITAVKKLGSFRIADKVRHDTTHVVYGHPRRTLNILQGMARGCWVVSQEWVLVSIASGAWINESSYEKPGDTFPAIKEARLAREAAPFGKYRCCLFDNVGSLFVSTCCTPPRAQLRNLLQLCGGKVTDCLQRAEFYLGDKVHGDKTCVKPVWVLDCISQQKLFSVDNYILNVHVEAEASSSPEF